MCWSDGVLLDELADLVAVLLRHDDVAENDVRTDLLDLLDGESAVADGHHVEVLVGEGQLDDLLDRDAVVGKQNLLAHRLFGLPSPDGRALVEMLEDRPFLPICQRLIGSGGLRQWSRRPLR